MDIMGLMKKAQAVQAKMKDVQDELERLEVEGQSGGGMVKITLSAKGQMKAIALDPSLMKPEDREMAEDLILAAHADAKSAGVSFASTLARSAAYAARSSV